MTLIARRCTGRIGEVYEASHKIVHKFPSINTTDTHFNICNHFFYNVYPDLLFFRNSIRYDRIIVYDIIFLLKVLVCGDEELIQRVMLQTLSNQSS